MMRTLLGALVVSAAACNEVPVGGHDMHIPDMAQPPICAPGEIGDAGIPATWSNVEKVIDQSCAFGVCHFTGFTVPGGDGLDLTHGRAYLDLVNKVAADPPNQCGGPIVTPFRPDQSYLLVKLTVPKGQQCNPKGDQMPIGEVNFQPLDDCQVDVFRRWILSGAPP